MLEIYVHEVRGDCPVFSEGDKIVVDDPELVLEETDAVCTHALDTILHYTTALEHGVGSQESGDSSSDSISKSRLPVDLGLSKEEGVAYMQCVDPGEPYTDGGTVVFRCEIEGSHSHSE